jgi:hypothetical protein
LNTAREWIAGAGTNTAALGFGGNPYTGATELWNGTSWTEVNDLNSPKAYMAGAGTSTDALGFGGYSPALSPNILAQTELWNGTSWTEVNDLSTARFGPGGTGTQTSALAFGGATAPPGTVTAATEEWTGEAPGTVTITTS